MERIKTEIRDTGFVAIILDETSDIVSKSQLSNVFRFIDENCEVQERFLGFSDVSADRTAAALFEHVNRTLEEFKCKTKLVANSMC